MKNELTVNPEQYGLEEKQANEITKGLSTILEERQVLQNAYVDVIDLEITEENLPTFRELRLQIVKNRTQGLKKWHKDNKAYFLAGGNFVQAIYNKEVSENERMEEALMKAEKHFENLEKERIEKLQKERENELVEYEVENIENLNLGYMSVEIWNNFLEGAKITYNNKIAEQKKIEEERIAKEKADIEERKRIAAENEKLKKEAEERERLAKIEAEKREKAEKERKAKEEAERKIREEKERKEREEYEAKLKAEREAKEKIEREEKAKREKLEAELRAKKEAEEKAEKDRLLAIENELKKGDADKLKDLVNSLSELKTKYEFKSKTNKEKYLQVGILIDKIINHIK